MHLKNDWHSQKNCSQFLGLMHFALVEFNMFTYVHLVQTQKMQEETCEADLIISLT